MTQQYSGRWSDRPKQDELEDAWGKIDPLLYKLLSLATPYGHEKDLTKFMPKGYIQDKKGNRIYNIGKMEEHKTIFSCHMDTVHRTATTIYPVIDAKGMVYAENRGGLGEVLGADDKIGVYIMLQMMAHKIPGRYIFHVGEESGCIGSKFIMTDTPSTVATASRAIAFDRMNYGDIINTQMGEICCSNEFIASLAKELNITMPPKQQFSGAIGVYTDTANYKYLVPECTNLSVGYFSQHGSSEHFDSIWLTNFLLPAVLKCEWTKLVTARDPVKAHTEYTEKQRRWNEPYKRTTVYSNMGTNLPKKEEVKPRLLITAEVHKKEKNPNELPFEQCTFKTPLFQIPDLKPFEVNSMPEDMNKGRLGVMAAIWKRYQVAGGYAFVNDIVTGMINYRAVLVELVKAQQVIATARKDVADLAAKVTASCDVGGVEIADRDKTITQQAKEIADQQAVIDDLRQQLKSNNIRRLH